MSSDSNSQDPKPELPITTEQFDEMVRRIFEQAERDLLCQSFVFGTTEQKRQILFVFAEAAVSRTLNELVRSYADVERFYEHSNHRECVKLIQGWQKKDI
jgi:hypothetical protein